MPKLALALVLAVAAALPAQAAARETGGSRATLPLKGVLVPGKSLAGVKVGDTPQQVLARWGSDYRRCESCALETWFFTYGENADVLRRGVGAAVSFRAGKAVAVFTLGATQGWRTSNGLHVGELVFRVEDTYSAQWKPCIGYMALKVGSTPRVVTSIYTDGNVIYGFALTHPSQPVCQ